MRKKHGFTLVELLVVMAIISILAAIAIPNVQKWIRKGRAVRAQAEISNIELAITKLLSDAGRSSLKDIISTSAIETAVGGTEMKDWTADQFEDAIAEYTFATYAILRKGRAVLGDVALEPYYNADVVRNLGTSYMSELSFDPWGNLYNIYPGPWRASDGPVPFRIYSPPEDAAEVLPGDTVLGASEDVFTLGVTSLGDNFPSGLIDPETSVTLPSIGAPAPRETDVFIWSNGENLISGQARYDGDLYHDTGYDFMTGTGHYDQGQEPELMGGGDDINNWDRGQTFMKFYN